MYTDIDDANEYFASRLNSEVWSEAENQDKISALTMAENKVNKLPFIGAKLSGTQTEPFPRVYKGQVLRFPDDVKKGIYEEALYLLLNSQKEDVDVPEGVQSLSLGSASVSFSDIKNTAKLSKLSEEFLSGWLRRGFDIESEKFREVY